MIQTFRIFRTGLFLVLGTSVLAAAGSLIYLNQVGFPGVSGKWIRDGLARKGIHVSFETLRFDFHEGLVATDVTFHAGKDTTEDDHFLKASEITLDLDKTKALRGDFKLLALTIKDGNALVPVTTDGEILEVEDLSGTLEMGANDRAFIREANGLIKGIQLSLSADLKLAGKESTTTDEEDRGLGHTDDLVHSILDELARWELTEEAPPVLNLHVEGDLAELERLQTSFDLEARDLSRKRYRLNRIALSGDLRYGLVTIDEILLEDRTGTIRGRADWSQRRRNGRFDLQSTIRPKPFLRECFEVNLLEDLRLSSPPVLRLRGDYSLPSGGAFAIETTGEVKLDPFNFRGTPFDQLTTHFSWDGENLFLRDLKLSRDDKGLAGNILVKGAKGQFDLRSTLPVSAFRPLMAPDSGLARALSLLSFQEQGGMEVDLVGTFDRENSKDWSAHGKARLEDLSYKGTALHHLESKFRLSGREAEFTEVSALLDDARENARLRHRGEASGELFADSIFFSSETKLVTLSNLRGKLWPTPIVRIFAPRTADHLEESYRFHEPPRLTLNGQFATQRDDYPQSTFSVAIRTTGQTDYPFLGALLPVQDLSTDVVVNGYSIEVKNLRGSTLNGTVAGSISCEVDPARKPSYRGAIKWDQLSFRELSKLYEFEEEEKGLLTGNIDFRGSAGSVRNLNASGIIAVKGGNLVSLPILGPLSPIIAGLLGDKRMGYERAKDASANFAIRNGVLQTQDFVAISTSVILTGEGWINLMNKEMDMVIRMNARGLLGLVTLPLQPLTGFFQFRGSGTYENPRWRSAPFTRPGKGAQDPIFQTPGQAQPVAE